MMGVRPRMYEMIHKQADTISYIARGCRAQATVANSMLRGARAYLTGCGSSYHAALYGEHTLRAHGIDARAVHALDILEYCATDLAGSVALILSHSWRTVTTLDAFRLLRRSGARCIALTSAEHTDAILTVRNSPVVDESDCVTLGYTSMLASLYLISAPAHALLHTSRLMDAIIAGVEEPVRALVDEYSSRSRFIFLGAGMDTATALEAALKMKEGNFTDSEGMHIEQFLHGSISGVEEGDVVFIVASSRSSAYAKSRVEKAVDALHAIGAGVVVVSDDHKLSRMGDRAVTIPECNAYEHPILAIVPLQLFAYYYAVSKGINPDHTREDDERYRNAYSILRLHGSRTD
ncbi:MAG: SIS domain-containing protein [Candidatus Nitrosocaldus sp.]|nr:SIS domain-containing protein [Candidatus Nitrosocaldus sp.]